MEIFAKHRFARVSARKARLVIDLVRGIRAERALEILAYTNKKSAPLIRKILVSALANAEHNQGLESKALWITKAFVDEGSSFKRSLPRAKGRGDHIIKRTSHITLAVSDQRG